MTKLQASPGSSDSKPASFTGTHRLFANNSREYEVSFREGIAVRVKGLGNNRVLWNEHVKSPMTPTVACVIRAAQQDLGITRTTK